MISGLIKSIFGTRNKRLLKEYSEYVEKINALEPEYQNLKKDDFLKKTRSLMNAYKENPNLSNLIPQAFAIVREASTRTLGLRHYDEQLLGGLALHFGKIAEMKTGEGKTLVSTLAAYLNSLTGNSVFIVTVNDYLAQRDSDWMGNIYNYLGLTVGTISSDMDAHQKKNEYSKNIVYGTNNEFGFDYLRDNMVYDLDEKVQGRLSYAIIDEVDSVLIDEARTPLIISGASKQSTDHYKKIYNLTKKIIQSDTVDLYTSDEKQKTVSLTEDGLKKAELLLLEYKFISDSESLYDPKNIQLMHLIDSSLRAQLMYKIDIDYVVENNQIIIIDEFSGRKMPGRRWSEGLHQSIEAKENVTIQNDNQTYASITFQNYFRLFDKISGMTGTADTEATEFQQIYNLEVVAIPTHETMIRNDHVDLVFLTMKEKFKAIIDEVKKIHEKHQPILIGTTSIESSEVLSKMLKRENIRHSVLNAKHHQKEAQIIAEAGKLKSVTIATNMAGRGTDIVLGGSKLIKSNISDSNNIEEVKKIGGLYIIGTERHESRRIDNQLRGRSGRQGDPGESRFFLSLEDNLMRIFASDKVSEIMKKLGMQDGEAIEHKWVSKSIENAQKRVEAHNFDIRKTLLEYDDISNEQRKVIYNQRNQILSLVDFSEAIKNIIEQGIIYVLENNIDRETPIIDWNIQGLTNILNNDFNINVNHNDIEQNDNSDYFTYIQKIFTNAVLVKINDNLEMLDNKDASELYRNIVLTVIDDNWRNHLSSMDYLRQGIGLRGYAQKNPKNEYKRESFEMFEEMLLLINYDITKILSRIKINNSVQNYNENKKNKISSTNTNQNNKHTKKSNDPRCLLNDNNIDIPRNKKCPVTNMKFKQCCGKI